MYFLPFLFFITAIVYASVGFGGGSTYTALLVLFDVDYRAIPIISLTCNLIVVSASSVYFIKHNLIDRNLITSLVIFSMPMSFLGGSLPISEKYFVLILGSTLLISSTLLYLSKSNENTVNNFPTPNTPNWKTGALLGMPIGLVAGITGIGGGIFLAPILHLLNKARAKTVAATACLFIFFNSIAGLIGQLSKNGISVLDTEHVKSLIFLPLSVLIGGLIGNRVAINYFTSLQLRRMTAILVFIVAIRLLLGWNSY